MRQHHVMLMGLMPQILSMDEPLQSYALFFEENPDFENSSMFGKKLVSEKPSKILPTESSEAHSVISVNFDYLKSNQRKLMLKENINNYVCDYLIDSRQNKIIEESLEVENESFKVAQYVIDFRHFALQLKIGQVSGSQLFKDAIESNSFCKKLVDLEGKFSKREVSRIILKINQVYSDRIEKQIGITCMIDTMFLNAQRITLKQMNIYLLMFALPFFLQLMVIENRVMVIVCNCLCLLC